MNIAILVLFIILVGKDLVRAHPVALEDEYIQRAMENAICEAELQGKLEMIGLTQEDTLVPELIVRFDFMKCMIDADFGEGAAMALEIVLFVLILLMVFRCIRKL
ncbi:hypothetical protein ACFFRR_008914 [Megaselia abdita]